jgi:hypothetical protein
MAGVLVCGGVVDQDLVVLVDALVAAVDTARSWEVERLHTVLAELGVGELFTAELRLNGFASDDCCVCASEGWL